MMDMLSEPAPKVLRPHQEKAITMIRNSFGYGNKKTVLQGATGFGKTLIAATIIRSALDKGKRVMFTAPAISLIDQTVAAFEAEGISDIGVMQANHPRTNYDAQVQIASVQTLGRRVVPDFDLCLVDECHVQFDVVNGLLADRDAHFIGLSATPWAKGMGLVWDDLQIPITISELIDAGYLSKFAAYAPSVPDLSGVKVRGGEYVEQALMDVMGDAKIVGDVVNTWLERAAGRPTLAFGVNCAHAQQMCAEFQARGVSAEYVDAHSDIADRAFVNREFRGGNVQVICSVRTMTTGVDLPVSCIIDAAPTRSEMLHVQKIGRGLRVNPGSEDCMILDHAGNSLRLGLVTDINHDELDKTERGERQQVEKNEKLPTPCSKCGTLHTGIICPSCGHEKKPPRLEAADGELTALTGVKVPSKAEKQAFWSMALWLAKTRKKSRSFALALYKNKFGVWPRGLHDGTQPADAEFLGYEKSRRIAYIKAKQKRESENALS